jgi:hypothetical protein
MDTLTYRTIVNPSVLQLRCATQIISRERVANGVAVTVAYSPDVASHVLREDEAPYAPTVIG